MFAHLHTDLLCITFTLVLSGYLKLLLISTEVKKKRIPEILGVILLAYKSAS